MAGVSCMQQDEGYCEQGARGRPFTGRVESISLTAEVQWDSCKPLML